MIEIRINGKNRALERSVPLRELVEHEVGGGNDHGIAVGINRRVVSRREWDTVLVQDGDEIEIVAPFSGG